jgi:hypothetical protein
VEREDEFEETISEDLKEDQMEEDDFELMPLDEKQKKLG